MILLGIQLGSRVLTLMKLIMDATANYSLLRVNLYLSSKDYLKSANEFYDKDDLVKVQ